jgi:hypothetical protein
MTQIMLRKLISPRHKCSIRHAGGLVQTGFWETLTRRIDPCILIADYPTLQE